MHILACIVEEKSEFRTKNCLQYDKHEFIADELQCEGIHYSPWKRTEYRFSVIIQNSAHRSVQAHTCVESALVCAGLFPTCLTFELAYNHKGTAALNVSKSSAATGKYSECFLQEYH